MLGDLLLALLWAGLFAIIFSDILRNDMSENRSARRRWFPGYEVLTFWVSLLILFVAVWAWLYPNEPVPKPNDPTYIYKGNKSVGHVTSSTLQQVLMGQYFKVLDQHEPLSIGEVLEFRDTH